MKLFTEIEQMIPRMGGWTSVAKAQTFASIVLAFRAEVCVEIGVWMGRGSLSVALALKELGRGVIHSIDAWSPQASVEGQHPADAQHWGNTNHDEAHDFFVAEAARRGVTNFIKVVRAKSRDVEPPENIGFLIIDGNHGDAAISDVERYAPKVKPGAFCYLDDLDWSTGSVRRAEARLKTMGFVELYPLDTGAMYQKLKA